MKPRIGIIGGSGLESAFPSDDHPIRLTTQYGYPSDGAVYTCDLEDAFVLYIARHGRRHTIPPTQVPYAANLQALKELGCDTVLATTACGSLRQDLSKGMIVIPDQFIDWTRGRCNTIYKSFPYNGPPAHVSMGEPFNEVAMNALGRACHITLKNGNVRCFFWKFRSTIVTIEGPRFSTRAESLMFQKLGGDVINMTTATEATIAKELNLGYATIALVTDYDAWKTDTPPVTTEEIFETIRQNSEKAINILKLAIKELYK